MKKVLNSNLWLFFPAIFMIMALSEIIVGACTAGFYYITSYFTIIELIMGVFIILAFIYCLINKNTKHRILTIVLCVVALVALIISLSTFSIPYMFSSYHPSRYLTLGQSAAFWYRLDWMVSKNNSPSINPDYYIDKSKIFVNYNFIVSIISGVATALTFTNPYLKKNKTSKEQ